jgi:hypothetical protein
LYAPSRPFVTCNHKRRQPRISSQLTGAPGFTARSERTDGSKRHANTKHLLQLTMQEHSTNRPMGTRDRGQCRVEAASRNGCRRVQGHSASITHDKHATVITASCVEQRRCTRQPTAAASWTRRGWTYRRLAQVRDRCVAVLPVPQLCRGPSGGQHYGVRPRLKVILLSAIHAPQRNVGQLHLQPKAGRGHEFLSVSWGRSPISAF